MKVAVLPFNVTEGTKAAYGRQFSNLVAETLRTATNADVHPISYMAQIQEDGANRQAHVNLGNVVMEHEFFLPLFKEASAEQVMHGLLDSKEGKFSLHLRFDSRDQEEPIFDETHEFEEGEVFTQLHWILTTLASQAGVELPEGLRAAIQPGTSNPKAFLLFLDGMDSFQYVQQANGNVTKEFQPGPALDALIEASKLDPTFRTPFDACIQLCRACSQYRIGTFEVIDGALQRLKEIAPNDYRPLAAMAEIHQSVGNVPAAVDLYEQALQAHLALGDSVEPFERTERAALYSRLGVAQLNMGMPVNAERNFRRALELEQDERPTLDLLSGVLAQTNRQHEIPNLWKEETARNPQSGKAWSRYATALLGLGQREEGIKVFEQALVEVDDSSFVKRFYAPVLTQTGDLDRAMDFYEDCLDLAPNDVPLMIEYANTLKAADREFEIPQVLRNVLASNPDADTRAQAQAWLVELEQPNRAEVVEEARKKLEEDDPDAAIRMLKPLRNWLGDYWKMWAVLAPSYNKMEMPDEAADAANRLLNIFPGYEAGYGELVQSLTTQGKNEEAYNVMRHAVNNVGSLGTHVNLALAAKRAGHEEEARTLAKQIRDVVGPNEELEPVLAEIEA